MASMGLKGGGSSSGGSSSLNVKNLLVAIVGLIVIGMTLPGLITSIGGVDVENCDASKSDPGEWSDEATAKNCHINKVGMKGSLGVMLNNGINLITPAAVIAAAAFGVLGGVKWVMNRAGED